MNYIHLFFMISIVGGSTILVLKSRRVSDLKKIWFSFTAIGIIIYSGLTTLLKKWGGDEYFWNFILYYIALVIGFLLCTKVRLKKSSKFSNYQRKNPLSFSERYFSNRFLKVMVVLYYSYSIVQLIYPVNNLSNLFNIKLTGEGMLSIATEARGNAIYQVFYYINMSTTIFYYIYIHRKLKSGKYINAILLIVLDTYLNIAIAQYISRSAALVKLLFIMIVVVVNYRKTALFKRVVKVMLRFSVILLISVPLLVAYTDYRLGVGLNFASFSSSIELLFEQEIGFGRHYDFCKENFSPLYMINYFVWLITLPIPSAIATFKSNIIMMNTVLSEAVLGVGKGTNSYYILLPSLFGEAMLQFSRPFSWIHGFILGLLLYVISTLMEKNRELDIATIYFATSCLMMGRGGMASAIPAIINTLFFYVIVSFFYKTIIQQKRK